GRGVTLQGGRAGGVSPTPKTSGGRNRSAGDKKPFLDTMEVANRTTDQGTTYVEETEAPRAGPPRGQVRLLLEGFSQPGAVPASPGRHPEAIQGAQHARQALDVAAAAVRALVHDLVPG